MTKRVTRQQLFYAFSPDLAPAIRVSQGEEFILETFDCFEGQIRHETDLAVALDWDHVNPATGPVYIEGAKPGDILRVDILEVKTAPQAVVTAIPDAGALGDVIRTAETAVLPLEGNHLVFRNRIRIPIQPMIGVIGVAPAAGSIPNGTPDLHGGNMDCKTIGAGSSLYLKVAVPGALFGCGDLHTVMGDGEIIVTGAETDGEVHARAQVVDLAGLPTPFLETADALATLASAPTVDGAANQAIHNMADFLTHFAGMPLNEAAMLMSLVGELKFCQVVDPQRTVRFEFPKTVLSDYGFHLQR
jgi:amidase